MPKLMTQDDFELDSYRQGEQNPRGIVVLQEIFGVNAHMRDVVEQFAREGYDAIAPALFDRVQRGVELDYSNESLQEGVKLRGQIPLEHTLADIQAAIDALDGKPTAIVGYCWGGTLAWQAACKLDGLRAASCWYGSGIAKAAALQPRVPVQMHFGAEDGSIPLDDVEAIRAAQPTVEAYVYEGAGHGFGCDQRSSFNAEAYALAQQRTLDFFARHLG